MNAIVTALAGSVGAVLLKLLMGLASEKFIKYAIILGLEKLSVITETDVDNQLLKAAKEAWEIEAPKKPNP